MVMIPTERRIAQGYDRVRKEIYADRDIENKFRTRIVDFMTFCQAAGLPAPTKYSKEDNGWFFEWVNAYTHMSVTINDAGRMRMLYVECAHISNFKLWVLPLVSAVNTFRLAGP